MTINSLMAQRTPYIYALPMSQMKEDFIAGKQAGATPSVEKVRAVGRRSAGTGSVDTGQTRTSGVRRDETAAQETAAAQQGVGVQQGGITSAIDRWMRDNAQAATFTPSQRVTEIQTPSERQALVERLRADTERQMGTLKDLSSKIFTTQVNGYSAARNYEVWDQDWQGFGDSIYHIDAQTREEAEQAVSDTGYWGVAQTSDRIVKYATALTGGDTDKIDTMIDAFEKGYQQAEKAWGGTLPDIAQRTRKAVLEQFQGIRDAASAQTAAPVQTTQTASAQTTQSARTTQAAAPVRAAENAAPAPVRTAQDTAPAQAAQTASVQAAKSAPVIQAVGATA